MRWLLALVLLLPSLAGASPTADLVARYTYRTGTTLTAPTGISFSAIGTTDSDPNVRPFHDLRYHIDYDDAACPSGQGNWGRGLGGRPRNSDRSPIGAHVYECAGTYTPVLTVCDASGNNCSKDSVTFTVESEDAGWTDANTTCVSVSGNFAGCPIDNDLDGDCDESPSSCITSSDWDANRQTAAGKRTLYRCNDPGFVISSTPAISDASSNGSLIGGYGDCATAPVLVTYAGTADILGHTWSGWVFRDHRITASAYDGDQDPSIIGASGTIDGFLLLRVAAIQAAVCPNTSMNADVADWHERVFFIDHECQLNDGHAEEFGWPLLFHTGRYGAILGFYLHGNVTGSGANSMRTMGFQEFFFAHGEWRGQGNLNLTLQFRAHNGDAGRGDEQYVSVQDWRVNDDGAEPGRTIALCLNHSCGTDNPPPSHDWLVEDILITYQNTQARSHVQNPFQVNKDSVTIRNVIVDFRAFTGTTGGRAITSAGNGGAAYGDDVHVYNSAMIRDANTTGQLWACNQSGASGARCRNNLLYEANASETDTSTTSGTYEAASNNVHLHAGDTECPFAGCVGDETLATPSFTFDVDEFKLRASGGGVAQVKDAGFDLPDLDDTNDKKVMVYTDMWRGCRMTATGGPDAETDIGPHEYGSSICTLGAGPSQPQIEGGGCSGCSITDLFNHERSERCDWQSFSCLLP